MVRTTEGLVRFKRITYKIHQHYNFSISRTPAKIANFDLASLSYYRTNLKMSEKLK